MTTKRFIIDDAGGLIDMRTRETYDYVSDVCLVLNELNDENEQLKQQLYYEGDSVCNICKHQYLVETEKYYVAKCEKGHEECSKEDIKYCEDFKFKELDE